MSAPSAFDAERFRRAEEIFSQVRMTSSEHRQSLLNELCAGDAVLLSQVEELLEAAGEMGTFLELPALPSVGTSAEENETGRETDTQGDQLIGRRLGAYMVVSRIGVGGMGAVYLGRRDDGQFEQNVAIKVVKRGMDSEEILERFRRERRTLGSLSHPNVARLLDAGMLPDPDCRPYLVMEYVEGVPIDEYCRERKLDLRSRLRLMLDVCAAVQAAHRSLIVHCDIKPANILVSAHGRPMLLDFGIAKLLSPSNASGAHAAMTAVAERRLTPEYASPEQISGQPITTATDVYALGVVLFQLLTGARPYTFETRTTREFERVVCTIEPPPPSRVAGHDHTPETVIAREELRGDLDAVVLTALAKQQERRYPSVEALASDLERYLNGRPVLARRAGRWYSVSKFVARHRLSVALAGVVLLAMSLEVVTVLVHNRRIARERDAAYAARDQAEAVAEFVQGALVAADISQDGPNARVKDLLGNAATRVEADLADRPLVLAAMHGAIGRGYLGLGMLREAEDHIQKSASLRMQLLEPGHHDLAETHMDLAAVRFAQRSFDDAERLLRQALQEHIVLRGEANPDTARVRNDLGAVLRAQGRLDEAEAEHLKALEIRRAHAPDSMPVAESLNNLANIAMLRGDITKAVRYLEQSLAIRQAKLRPEHPLIVQSLYNLGSVLARAGDAAAGARALKQAAAGSANALGNDHPERARILRAYGATLAELGFDSWAEAESTLREALRIERAAQVDTAQTEGYLGLCLATQGRDEEARPLIESALRALPADDPRAKTLRGRLTAALDAAQRTQPAP